MRLNSSFRFAKKSAVALCFIASFIAGVPTANSTTVQFQTVMGDFEVNLYDKATPKTVANFLAYVNANAYSNVIIHRSVKDFVIQGGGYKYTGMVPPAAIPARVDAENKTVKVESEPVYSNVRGTIAMAKQSNDVNNATNQWFINLGDNSTSLDIKDQRFTVFGQVTGNGMGVVDAIAAVNRFNMGGAFETIPLRNYTAADASSNVPITGEHLVTIDNIVVLDASPDTADTLTPTPNTLVNKKDNSGSGAFGYLEVLFLCLVALASKRRFGWAHL